MHERKRSFEPVTAVLDYPIASYLVHHAAPHFENLQLRDWQA
jgi:hypothetical protein